MHIRWLLHYLRQRVHSGTQERRESEEQLAEMRREREEIRRRVRAIDAEVRSRGAR